jgi:N-acetylmuramoyl-L-alanine amidase
MTIIDHPSPNHSARKPGVRVDIIVVHHTGTHTPGAALTWLCNPEAKASAHYVVGESGRIWRLVPEDRTAWHAGVSQLPWEKPERKGSVNARSIGIELVNPGDGKTPFTEAQYAALAWLVPDIARRYGWNFVRLAAGWRRGQDPEWHPSRGVLLGATGVILGHRDVAPGRKTDPADNFDWGRIRRALEGMTL